MINRRCRKCCCMNNNSQCYNPNVLETSCNNTCSCTKYNNDCDCGFDEDMDVFPSNPMLSQSYVPFQYMEETFKPKSLYAWRFYEGYRIYKKYKYYWGGM